MKKYVILGLVAGATISAFLLFFKKRGLEGDEFHEFFDSSAVTDDLFGEAFQELPDKP